jgi:site-specific DNA-methyltransferase (adenine-specific)
MTFLKIDKSEILLGDSFKLLSQLPRNRFNLLLTDPPFCVSRKNNYTSMGRRGIDFGEWDKNFDQFTWIELATPLIKPWGSIVIWNDWKKLGHITDFLEELKFDIKTVLTWKKPNPAPFNCKRRFLQSTEHAIWAVKPGKRRKGHSWIFNSNYHHGFFEHGVPQHKHPTKKPTEIFKEIVEILTNPGDWILDPFCGSGTTAVACEATNRNFVCIEKDPNYYKLALKEYNNYQHAIL